MFDQFFNEMQAEDAVGLLLAVQLHNTPDALDCVVQSTMLDHSIGRLKPQNQYIIHAANVAEHKVTLGLFDEIHFVDQHPLLYHHNAPRVSVFISGVCPDLDGVLANIAAAHTELFGTWREITASLNGLTDLDTVLKTGFGLIGKMPEPFARAVAEIFTRHGIQHNLLVDETPITPMKLLAIDSSYFVATDFQIELVEF